MTFRWEYRPAETAGAGPGPVLSPSSTGPGSSGPAADQSFVSQSDAESWLGENWRELADGGVEQVVLLDNGKSLYEMSLLAD